MCRALGVLGSALVAVTLAAEEPAPAPAPRAAPENTRTSETRAGSRGLAATERDLELIKATREPAASIAGAWPGIAAPEWPHGPATAPLPRPAPAPKAAGAAQKKSAHWLVKTMERKPEEHGAKAEPEKHRGHARDDHTPAAEFATGQEIADVAGGGFAGENREREAGKRDARGVTVEAREGKPEPAPNPFAPYLAGWMTPADYALLKPVLEAANGADLGAGGAANAANAASFSFLPGPSAAPSGPPRDTAPENPFLQAMAAVSASVTVGAVGPSGAGAAPANPAPAAVIFTPAIEPAPPLPTPAAKATQPDFVKPQSDEKYFKPLRRF
jgi:hypothetical protein